MPYYTCYQCKKSFVTDNAWIACAQDEELTVLGRFCSEPCRTNWCVDHGWRFDSLMRLQPPKKRGNGK